MKDICEADPDWPKLLEEMRVLCRFFRNEGYRNHLKNCLRGRIDPNILEFSAGFLKWRYETIAEVIKQLLPLRHMCQTMLRPELFPNIQDKELLKPVCNACADEFVWKWCAAVGGKVIVPIEGIRHWSLVCNCPHHVKEHHEKKVQHHCMRASRRLDEVLTFTTKRKTELKEKAAQFTEADAENDANVLRHFGMPV